MVCAYVSVLDKHKTANFIKINSRPLQNVNSLQMHQKAEKCVLFMFIWFVAVVAFFRTLHLQWACLCCKWVSEWVSVWQATEMKGLSVYAVAFVSHKQHAGRCRFSCCGRRRCLPPLSSIVAVMVLFSSSTIFRNGQWKWHKMTYPQIGSNRTVFDYPMIFMATSLHFIMCNEHYFITFTCCSASFFPPPFCCLFASSFGILSWPFLVLLTSSTCLFSIVFFSLALSIWCNLFFYASLCFFNSFYVSAKVALPSN